ncbi:hypothetical protein O0L34_g16830 [Tuta absoluta]|nr:hypothetical protein O0L34_g16830 [Tuta absoluta]
MCGEVVLALTPGLQLAAHHCRKHPALLPALRCVCTGVMYCALYVTHAPCVGRSCWRSLPACSSPRTTAASTQHCCPHSGVYVQYRSNVLCSLCDTRAMCGEVVLALTPGLQLAAHHCRKHPALLPALRCVCTVQE